MRILLFSSVVFLLSLQALADTPSGTWKWDMDLQDQTINSVLTLASDGDSITGKYSDQNVSAKLENGKLTGNKLTFTIATTYNGAQIGAEFDGELQGDAIQGEIELFLNGDSVATKEWSAKRFVGMADVVGTWNFDYTAPDGNNYKPTLVLKKKGGKLQGEISGSSITNVDLKDNKLSFDSQIDYNGVPMKLTYVCEPRGNAITGILKYDVQGNVGEFDINATKKVLAPSVKAMLGAWNFEFTGPDGIDRKSLLTLTDKGGEVAAKLETDGQSHDVSELKAANSTVSFEFVVEHDGLVVELTWESEMSGKDEMEGTLSFDVEGNVGDIPIEGTRKN